MHYDCSGGSPWRLSGQLGNSLCVYRCCRVKDQELSTYNSSDR